MRAGRPRSQVVCIAAVCAMRMTVSREPRLLEQGHGATGLPHAPHPREGVGGRSPPKRHIHPVGVRRSRMDG